jgi:hypothetical protein
VFPVLIKVAVVVTVTGFKVVTPVVITVMTLVSMIVVTSVTRWPPSSVVAADDVEANVVAL